MRQCCAWIALLRQDIAWIVVTVKAIGVELKSLSRGGCCLKIALLWLVLSNC